MNTTSEIGTNKVDKMRERLIEAMRGTRPPQSTDEAWKEHYRLQEQYSDEAPCVATQPHHPTSTDRSSDISIRDHFAAAALQGLMAYYGGFCDQDAKAAYAAADAMLKAKEAKP